MSSFILLNMNISCNDSEHSSNEKQSSKERSNNENTNNPSNLTDEEYSLNDLITLKSKQGRPICKGENCQYQYLYFNNKCFWAMEYNVDTEGYPLNGVFQLYFQPGDSMPCLIEYYDAENFIQNMSSNARAAVIDGKINNILSGDKFVKNEPIDSYLNFKEILELIKK